jgi:hypothetical protein
MCLGCQVNTHFFLVNHLGISSLQYSLDWSITPQVLKKKSLEIFSPLFETYSIGFISSPLALSSISFFGKIFDPAPLFNFPILMAHTRSQDLESRFNTLQYGLIETQQEVKQPSANVVAINTTMQSSMEEIKECSPLPRCSPSRSRMLAVVVMEKNFSSRVYCLDTLCGRAL